MFLLLLVSLIWAFSFGLIKGRLTGLDPAAVAVVRIAISALIFVPLLRRRSVSGLGGLRYAAVGALQFGAMYVFYLRSFEHLQAHEVALFTIFTPLYLAGFDALLDRRVRPGHWVAALLSIAGTALVMNLTALRPGLAQGFLLVQLSNLCFAAGQLAYKRIRAAGPAEVRDSELFGWLYLGALGATGLYSLQATDWSSFHPSPAQWGVLAYLGLLASGLGFFWWNLGALRVNTGTLAAFNNAKVPLGVACSLLFFNEHADPLRLGASLAILTAAVVIAERSSRINAPAAR